MAKTIKQAKADIYLRDTDSQSLFNNSGELSFMYFHEWNDCYDKNTGKTAQIDGETYDESTGTYKPNCPSGCIPVFNGRQSALWDNMVSCFPDRIKSMYVTMRNNGLSYKDMLMKYKEFWRYWCENLYNADAFGYANTGRFDMAFGDKLQMMDYFFQKRQRYLDSKYCCGSSVSNNLRMRLSEVGKGFAIKYYQAIYSSLQWAVGSFDTQRNIEPGTYSYMPWKMAGNPQDTTFDIDDADLITELSTYTKNGSDYTISGLEGVGNFKFDSNMGILKRLTKFVMNYTEDKPNTNELGAYFDLSGMTLLKQVIVRNVKNLTKSIVINSDVVEEIDFMGTPIVGVTTPPSDSLTKLVLPDTITVLKLKGYTNLQSSGLQIAGYSNINEFEIENCPNLDTIALLTECYKAGAPLTEVTLKDIDWTLDSMDLLMYLAEKKAKLQGKITISAEVPVSLTQKVQLLAAFGDIDDVDNSLYISYNIYQITSASIIGKSYLANKGDYTFEVSTSPNTGNNIKSLIWSISENNFATINQSGVLTLSKTGSVDTDDKAIISLTMTLSDGSSLQASKEVYFYKKTCELGDYVFSDGTWGSKTSDNPKCSPVAVIFYLEPVKRRYALAVSNTDALQNSVAWGLSSEDMQGIQLNEYVKEVYNIYDIEDTEGNLNDINSIIDDSAIDNDGFKVAKKSNILGDIGFEDIKDLDTDLMTYINEMGLKEGDMISTGQLKTLKIIKHRNHILSDSAVNLDIPKATDVITESQSLNSCISKVIADNNSDSKYSQYYYPAASYCYAFSPTNIKKGEKLNDMFKPHNWFLPSIGELIRIGFYFSYLTASESKYNIFKKAYNEGYLRKNTNQVWSSSEMIYSIFSKSSSYSFNTSNNKVYNESTSFSSIGKSQLNKIRPIIAIKL